MAAPIVNTPQSAKTIRAKKQSKPSLKKVLVSPFDVRWPVIDDEDSHLILNEIKCTFEKLHLNVPKPSIAIKKQGKEALAAWQNQNGHIEAKKIRKELVFGINNATKMLERDLLAVLVVCRDTPLMMTKHLIPLCATRNCPGLCLSNVGALMEKVVGFRAAAVGFKKSATNTPSAFHQLIKYLSDHTTKLDTPFTMQEKKDICGSVSANIYSDVTDVCDLVKVRTDIGNSNIHSPLVKSNFTDDIDCHVRTDTERLENVEKQKSDFHQSSQINVQSSVNKSKSADTKSGLWSPFYLFKKDTLDEFRDFIPIKNPQQEVDHLSEGRTSVNNGLKRTLVQQQQCNPNKKRKKKL